MMMEVTIMDDENVIDEEWYAFMMAQIEALGMLDDQENGE